MAPAGKTYTNTMDDLKMSQNQDQMRKQDSLNQNQSQNLIPTLTRKQQELGTLQSLANLLPLLVQSNSKLKEKS